MMWWVQFGYFFCWACALRLDEDVGQWWWQSCVRLRRDRQQSVFYQTVVNKVVCNGKSFYARTPFFISNWSICVYCRLTIWRSDDVRIVSSLFRMRKIGRIRWSIRPRRILACMHSWEREPAGDAVGIRGCGC